MDFSCVRFILALEIPSDHNFSSFATYIQQVIGTKISLQKISKGISQGKVCSAILEVAEASQLEKLKELFPEYKEANATEPAQSEDNTVVVVVKAKVIPKANCFRAALSQFGKMSMIKIIKPSNVLVKFERTDSAKDCLQKGGINVDGRRYLVRNFIPKGTQTAERTKPCIAWLHGLPAYIQDYHLTGLMESINAIHWQVSKVKNVNTNTTITWAKVHFRDEAQRNEVTSQYIGLDGRPLQWRTSATCVMCGSSKHLGISCDTDPKPLPHFGGRTSLPKASIKVTPGLSFRNALVNDTSIKPAPATSQSNPVPIPQSL
jgi:hypothetical protein